MTDLCAHPLDCSTSYGELTIDGWSLHTGAWCVPDLSPIYESPEFRGDNVLVETEHGRVARPIVTDETDYALRMMFSGAVDRSGTGWTNHAGGVLANRRAFVDHYIAPIRNGTAALPATLVVPDPDTVDGTLTFEFDVQPLRLTWNLLPGGYARAVLRLRVPVPDFAADPYATS